MRGWEDNAREFGALIRQGKDVRLALLVACSVEKDQGRGNRLDRAESKVSATAFAREAGTSKDRIVRHLEAWGRLFELELVRPAQDLTPADAETYAVSEAALEAFPGVYDARQTKGLPAAPAVGEALRKPEKREDAIAGMSVDERAELAAAAIGSNKAVAEQVAASPKAGKAVRRAAQSEEEERERKRRTQRRPAGQPTTVSQRFWTIVGQMTEWTRALLWMHDSAADLGALSPWQREELIREHERLQVQVARNLALLRDQGEEVLEGQESAPRRELSA